MHDDAVLGISIDTGEITSAVVDARTGELLSRARVPLGSHAAVLTSLEELVQSAPNEVRSIGIACADPATQKYLSNLLRLSTDAPDGDRQTPPSWLARTTLMATSTALATAASHLFAGAGRVVVANIDSSGRPVRYQPVILVDPSNKRIVDTANLKPPTATEVPLTQPAGASSLASAFAELPLSGNEMITLAGAGAGIPDLAATFATALNQPVRVLRDSTYVAARGAALFARSPRTNPGAAARPLGRHRGLLIAATVVAAALAAVGVAAALMMGDNSEPANTDAPALSPTSASASATSYGRSNFTTPQRRSSPTPTVSSPPPGTATTTTGHPLPMLPTIEANEPARRAPASRSRPATDTTEPRTPSTFTQQTRRTTSTPSSSTSASPSPATSVSPTSDNDL